MAPAAAIPRCTEAQGEAVFECGPATAVVGAVATLLVGVRTVLWCEVALLAGVCVLLWRRWWW
jgi:hypothetical protein